MPQRVSPEKRAAAVTRLRDLAASGSLTAAHVRLAASGLGVSQRTVWRWLAGGTREQPVRLGRPGHRLTGTDREAYALFRGNVAAVHRARSAVLAGAGQAAGVTVPGFLRQGWAGSAPVSLRALQAAFARELTPAEAAAWKHGEQARRAADVYLRRPPARRNQAWEADHTELPLMVLPPRGPAVCPWLTSVIDDGTRALIGWAIALTPHAGTVLTALRMALAEDPARGPFGGVPAVLRIDRGLEFAAGAVRDAMAVLCVRVLPLPKYVPHRKGKIERLNATIDSTLLCGLPGYTGGPRDAAGRLYGPVDDRSAARAAAAETGGPMRIEALAERFAAWVNWYNTERPHSQIDGRTPLQAWADDQSAVHRISDAELRHLLLAGAERTIGKDGVRLRGLAYIAPELQGRRGQQVQVRFMPHDDRFIEVYLGTRHLCTAYPQGQLTAEEADQFRAHARDQAKRLAAQRRQAAARARAELTPLTRPGPAEQSRLIPSSAEPPRTARRRDEQLRRAAATDLLGLHPPAAQPPKEP